MTNFDWVVAMLCGLLLAFIVTLVRAQL